MAVLNIELSEYDAMRNRNKELENRVKQLEKELEGCKNGSRVIIRKVMDKKEFGRLLGYSRNGMPVYENQQTSEVVVAENYVNFDDVRMRIEDKMKEAIEESIRYHTLSADEYDKKKELLDNKYSRKQLILEQEYQKKKDKLDEMFGGDIKKFKEECDKVISENAEIKRAARGRFSSIYKLATEATEKLESMWFKPHHAISLVREIANMTK